MKCSTLAVVLAAVAFAHPATATEGVALNPAQAAAVALVRFTANQQDESRTQIETIEIEASLPKLKKTGRLRAIRRTVPGRPPEYQIVETGGDSMVKHQVLVRYILADQRAAELPAMSTAVTPGNYTFHYVGAIQLHDKAAYVFRIIPRKKREGLMNGLVWVDAERGDAVRQSGYLVKNPSVLVKRIHLTRQNYFRDGRLEARVTHIVVDTRVVGTVRLVVIERPMSRE